MSKKLPLCVFLLVLACSLLFAGASTEEKNVVSNEIKVVSLAPNVTEIICALGSQDSLIGRTTYCNYPETVLSVQNVGDMYDPNIELIISINPDAVIASSIVSPDVVEQLNKYGIKTYQFFHEYEGLNGTYLLIQEIGEVLNKSKQASELISELKAKEKTITDKTSQLMEENKKTCTVMITWGEWGDYAATGDTFIEDIILKAGGINIASESTYWAISRELLISKDPDYIFITDTSNYVSNNILDAFKSTEPYSLLKASRNNHVFVLNNDAVSRQSIRSFEVLNIVAETLYPELF